MIIVLVLGASGNENLEIFASPSSFQPYNTNTQPRQSSLQQSQLMPLRNAEYSWRQTGSAEIIPQQSSFAGRAQMKSQEPSSSEDMARRYIPTQTSDQPVAWSSAGTIPSSSVPVTISTYVPAPWGSQPTFIHSAASSSSCDSNISALPELIPDRVLGHALHWSPADAASRNGSEATVLQRQVLTGPSSDQLLPVVAGQPSLLDEYPWMLPEQQLTAPVPISTSQLVPLLPSVGSDLLLSPTYNNAQSNPISLGQIGSLNCTDNALLDGTVTIGSELPSTPVDRAFLDLFGRTDSAKLPSSEQQTDESIMNAFLEFLDNMNPARC